MRLPHSLPTALLVCAGILSNLNAFGQSLSLSWKENSHWIEATAPADSPHVLQTSENLHLWIDLENISQEPYSLQLTNTTAAQRYFRLIATPEEAPAIRVMLLGDSLCNECCGWGPGFSGYFKPNATVINYAIGGYSTKVFLRSAEKNSMLLIKPDYVLINFGAFDDLRYPEVSTTPEEYSANLRTIAELVRGFNGVPIFVTVHAAQSWDDNGNLVRRWDERNGLMKQAAAELGTPLIDLHELTTGLLNQLGRVDSAFMRFAPGGPTDVIHVSPLGGQYVGRLLATALPGAFGPYLTGIFEPPPKPSSDSGQQ